MGLADVVATLVVIGFGIKGIFDAGDLDSW